MKVLTFFAYLLNELTCTDLKSKQTSSLKMSYFRSEPTQMKHQYTLYKINVHGKNFK